MNPNDNASMLPKFDPLPVLSMLLFLAVYLTFIPPFALSSVFSPLRWLLSCTLLLHVCTFGLHYLKMESGASHEETQGFTHNQQNTNQCTQVNRSLKLSLYLCFLFRCLGWPKGGRRRCAPRLYATC